MRRRCRATAAEPKSRAGRAGYNYRFNWRSADRKVRRHRALMTYHDLAEMELTELEQALESMGHPRFHARQLFQWLHKRGITDFGGMTDLGRDLRASLADAFRIVTPEVIRKETSSDGTTKFLLRLEDGQLIESVVIPDTPANNLLLF